MKKYIFIGVSVIFTFFCLFTVLSLTLVSGAEENIISSYTNVFKNEKYFVGTTIQTLNQKIELNYQSPVDKNIETKAKRKKGEYGIEINGEFHMFSYTFEKTGYYVVSVYDYYYDYKENVYKCSDVLREKFILEIIEKEVPKLKENYYIQNYLNGDDFVSNVEKEVKELGLFLSVENKKNLKNCFNSVVINSKTIEVSIDINDYNFTFNILDARILSQVFKVYFDTPIVIDLNFFDENILNKGVTELYDIYLGLKFEVSEYISPNIKAINDVIITNNTGSYKINYQIENNINNTITFTERNVYIINSADTDTIPPIIEFESDLYYDYVDEITEESIFKKMEVLERIEVFSLEKKTPYGIKNISTNYNEVIKKIKGPGTYEIEYEVRDDSNNFQKYTRKIIVRDVDAPKILKKYNYIEVEIDDLRKFDIGSYYTIIDNYDTSFEETVKKEDYDGYSVYTITVSDSSGNESIESIIVRYKNSNWFEKNIYPILLNYKRFWVRLFTGEL